MHKLVETVRGSLIENIHYGSIIVSDTIGNIIAKSGEDITTYLRSAAKPLQLLPLIETGAAEKFGFSNKELAIMAGSHYGTKEHEETIASILNKLSLPAEALQCGIHDPFSQTYTKELKLMGKSPTVLNNNCSGKHASMLALCKLYNWDITTYLSPTHPVQRLMLKTISEMSDVPEDKIAIGVDGCGVPVFGFALSAMAKAYARLGVSDDLSSIRQKACVTVGSAMREYPEMVAGEGVLDTVLLSLPDASIISKIGAEAVYCISVPNKGVGIAIKISDGNMRMVQPVVVETLIQLNILSSQDIKALEKFQRLTIKNFAKNIVGETRPSFSLQFI